MKNKELINSMIVINVLTVVVLVHDMYHNGMKHTETIALILFLLMVWLWVSIKKDLKKQNENDKNSRLR